MAMKSFNYNGTMYYIDKGKVYNDEFIGVCEAELTNNILGAYYNTIDYKKMLEEELLIFIKTLKDSFQYAYCIIVAKYALDEEKLNGHNVGIVLPIITSCFRLLDNPQGAIEFFESIKGRFEYNSNQALLTSVGAAYADMSKYEMAYKYANQANAITIYKGVNPPELIALYSRLKKVTGGD